MRKLALIFACLVVAAIAAAGCGRDEAASSSTSSLAPAGAVMYGEAQLRPAEDKQQAIDALLAKFPGDLSAGKGIGDLIEKALTESDSPISYKKDVQPWLGDDAAFFLLGDAEGELENGAALIATEDEDAAREALEKSFEGKAKQKSYKDVDYLVGDDQNAGAVFDGYLAVGSVRGLKAAIDTSDGGANLEDSDRYKDALADASEDRLGLLFINLPELVKGQSAQAMGVLGPSFQKLFEQPYVVTADADADGLSFESAFPAEFADALPFLGQGSKLMPEVPGDAWLAIGQPDVGALIDSYVDLFARAAGGRDVIEQQFQSTTGLDLNEVTGWMGEGAVFVRGTSMAELNGALVVETSDPAATRRFIDRLGVLARSDAVLGGDVSPLRIPGGGAGFELRTDDVPQPIQVLVRDNRFVIAYGASAAPDALAPAQTLGDTPEYQAAAKSLEGYEPGMYLAGAPVIELVENLGASSSPDWQMVRPYLEPLTAMIGGVKKDSGRLDSAFKLFVE